MNDLNMHPLEAILHWCAEAAPNPWYPSTFTQASGIPRERLDPFLDELRLGGLIRLTDWVQGRGQGYTLTPVGTDVLQNPRLLEQLRAHGVPRQSVAPRPAREEVEVDATTYARGEQIRAALLNPSTPRVTITLVVLNLVVFFYGLMLAQRGQAVPANKYVAGEWSKEYGMILLESGAMTRWTVFPDNEWWRLLTACFVHIGLLHLGVNMFSLYMVGPLLERMWGPARYLALYLIAGFGGNCAVAMLSTDAPMRIVAGASGALWGVLASMVAWILLNRSALPRPLVTTWLRQLTFVFILNIILTQSVKNISAEAHYGGGIVGLVVAVPLNYLMFTRGWRRVLALAGVVAVPVLCVGLLVRSYETHREWEEYEVQIRYIGKVRPVLSRINTTYQQLDRLLREDPAERHADKEAVRDARRQADEMLAEITPLNALFQEARTYQDPVLQARMENYKSYLKSWVTFLPLFKRALQEQNWTRKEERELQRQWDRVERFPGVRKQ